MSKESDPSPRRWSHMVKTVSTFPPEKLYTKDARTIARVMAKPEVSPKGLGSAIKMVQFFINRAGRSLPAARRRELEKAKRILQEQNEERMRSERGKRTETRVGKRRRSGTTSENGNRGEARKKKSKPTARKKHK